MSSWLKRLSAGLARSSDKLTQGIGSIFARGKLDADALEELEELLIAADLGLATATKLTARLGARKFEGEVTPETVRQALAEEIAQILEPVARPLAIDAAHKPFVILVVGVNGSGKTTTIGKLAARFKAEGKSVLLAAGDTFRAAAIEQLQIWGQRAGVPVIAKEAGSDAAALAYEALAEARAQNSDVLLIDTAGRLHNKAGLMAELQKIERVLAKQDASAPHAILLVLDATTGQNALQQVKTFKELVKISGLILTKIDGSAKGGVLVALAESFALPVHAVGVGETADDLRPFAAESFAKGLVGLSE